MTSIETERLMLRPFTMEDAPALHAAVYGDEAVMTYLPGGIPRSVSKVEGVIEYYLTHWEHWKYGVWAVTDKESGDLLGQAGLNYVADLQEVEVLYALGRSTWGKGYATEAANAAMHYGFEKHQLDKIIAMAAPDNDASIRVLKKLGMTFRYDVKLWKMKLRLYALPRQDFKYSNAPYEIHI
jgi:RimJ/RimL family protein N-acetyltransferase